MSSAALTPTGSILVAPTNATYYQLHISLTNGAGVPVSIPLSSAAPQAITEAGEILAADIGSNWANAALATYAYPVYDAAINGGTSPAYLEFKVIPATSGITNSPNSWGGLPLAPDGSLGYILVSLTTQDVPVPDFGTDGPTYVEQLMTAAGTSSIKAFRYGDGFWAAEDGNGNLLATVGTSPYPLPTQLPGLDGTLAMGDITNNALLYDTGAGLLSTNTDYYDTYQEFKQDYISGPVYTYLRARQAETALYRWNEESNIAPTAVYVTVGAPTQILPSASIIGFDIENTAVASGQLSGSAGMTIVGLQPGGTILHVLLSNSTSAFYTLIVNANQPTIRPQALGGWGPFVYNWAGNCNNQPKYDQFQFGDCLVGCGPCAWAMLYGWWDITSNPNCGLIETCPTAPTYVNDAAVMACMKAVNAYVLTFCAKDNLGATLPSTEAYGANWGSKNKGRTVNEVWEWCVPYAKTGPAITAYKAIVNDKHPAIIGIGFLRHYPLAFGYASRVYTFLGVQTDVSAFFFVNQGWGGDPCKGDWVNSDSVWFGNQTSIQ